MSDLEVAAWLQDYSTKKMYNSHFMYGYTDIHPYPVQNLQIGYTETAIELTWDAPESDNVVGYNVYESGVLIAESISETSLTLEDMPSGYYPFIVEAVYENEMTSVGMFNCIEFNSHLSAGENGMAAVSIYPNPTNGNITVCGNNISMVEVYNLCGQKVVSVEKSANTVNVNMSELTTGVYMVKIVDGNGNATVNKVVKR